MTTEEIVVELRKLCKEWQVRGSRYDDMDSEYASGREDGKEYCAEDINFLIHQIERK